MSCCCCTVLMVLAGIVAVWWVLLKMRVIPKAVTRIYLTASIFALVCISSAACFLIDLLRVAGIYPRQKTGDMCAYACAIIFRTIFFFNPQITVHIDESEVKWNDIPKRICLLSNHTSFLDALIVTAFCPVHFIVIARTLMKSSLRKLPIFGGVFDRVGHFPVYFKSDETGAFSVDKERQAKVSERVLAHIQRDGRLTIFPEGQMNKNPINLLPFRHGTFQTVIQNKMEMYYCLMWGNDEVWPGAEAIPSGGNHDIYIKLGRIGYASENEDSQALSSRCQDLLQGEVTALANHAKRESAKHK